uniref:Uncharacterized protein n=1 Tax=Arundo donax TaxID=35708 RepID=A0A0A9BWS4_ARUDO
MNTEENTGQRLEERKPKPFNNKICPAAGYCFSRHQSILAGYCFSRHQTILAICHH